MRKVAIEQGKGGRFLHSMAKMEGRTCLACRLGRLAAERHWRSLAPRHALRRAQPHLVAKTFGTLTKNGEVSTRLTSPFLAGAEGLEPSARGFGVDVSRRTRERGRNGVGRFSWTSHKRVVLVWCCGEIWLGPSSGQIATGTIWHSSRIFWISTADSSFFSARVTASFSKKSQLADRISFALR